MGQAPGVSVRVLAGESLGVKGPIKMVNPGLLMDVRLDAGATHKEAVPEGWSGFAYVYEGEWAGREGARGRACRRFRRKEEKQTTPGARNWFAYNYERMGESMLTD